MFVVHFYINYLRNYLWIDHAPIGVGSRPEEQCYHQKRVPFRAREEGGLQGLAKRGIKRFVVMVNLQPWAVDEILQLRN